MRMPSRSRLVAQVGDALDPLVAHQVGDLLDQPRLVHLVGDLGDDDRLLLAAALGSRSRRARASGSMPRPVRVGLADAGAAVDEAAGREVRAGHDLDQLSSSDVAGRRSARQIASHDLAQVVRRDVGRHADRDAGRAVDQQVRARRAGSTIGSLSEPS